MLIEKVSPLKGSSCVNDKNLGYPIASLFGETDFEDRSEAHFRRLIFLSQLAQTLCIKTKLEEFRRGAETFGALMWQLNDVWQASSWGSLDYGGRWRALKKQNAWVGLDWAHGPEENVIYVQVGHAW